MTDIKILFVDDEVFTLNALERLLRKEPYKMYFAENGTAALGILEQTPIDILVTDMKMPEMDGLTLLKAVKERYPGIVRLALSAYTMTGQLLPCINTGEIFRFIAKPIEADELKQSIKDAIDFYLMTKNRSTLVKELKALKNKLQKVTEYKNQLEKTLQNLAITDEHTSLFNQHYLMKALDHEFEACQRHHQNLSCLLVEPDYLKCLGGKHSPLSEDIVLKELASRLKDTIRSEDVAFHYGSAFLILLPRTSIKKALISADKVLKIIKHTPIKSKEQPTLVTVSIGVVCFKHHHPQTPKEMLEKADEMLQTAQKNGGDRIHSTFKSD